VALYHYKDYIFQCITFFSANFESVRHKQAAEAGGINHTDLSGLSIFLFVLIHTLIAPFTWSLMLLLKLSSLPCSYCGLVNDSIWDSVLLQASVVKKPEH